MDVSHLTRRFERRAAPGGGRAARCGAGARGRGQRQDPRAGASRGLAHPGGRRLAAQHPRRHLHQQGGRGDAPPHRGPAGASRAASLWIGTFHGLAHRLLRLHWREAGLPQSFQILDAEDQARLLRKVLKALELDETRWVPREILWFINAQKDEGLRAKHLKDDGDPTRRQLIQIYHAYEEACQRGGRGGFRRAPAARLRAVAGQSLAPRALSHALSPRAGGRVSGHQRHPVQLAHAARRPDGSPSWSGDDDQCLAAGPR